VVVVDGIGGSVEQPQDGMASTINCAGQKGNDGGAIFNNQLRVRQPKIERAAKRANALAKRKKVEGSAAYNKKLRRNSKRGNGRLNAPAGI
jgi:hypothetical protein